MKSLQNLGITVWLFFVAVSVSPLKATIKFHNRSAMIAMKSTNSVLRVNEADKITGWSEESIVKDFGNEASSSWVETYTDDMVVSQAGGGAHTNLLYSTSNVVEAGVASVLATNNSNALLQLTTNNSNAILASAGGGSALATNNSNALLQLTTNNSNAIIAGGGGGGSALATANSNALLFCCNNNSNTILVTKQIAETGASSITIAGPQYDLTNNVPVSNDANVTVTGNTFLDGNGHAFDFACGTTHFIVAASKEVLFRNIQLRNYVDGSITLGAGASVVFGEDTLIELKQMQTLSSNMTISGEVTINGFGNRLMMDDKIITVRPGGRLTLQDLDITDVKQNNIRAQGDSACIKFKNTKLKLSQNYSFTAGRILFEMDCKIAGTSIFTYGPTNAQSQIMPCSKLVLDTGVTFSYDVASANRDLLGMGDETSQLCLNGCTVNSTITGMRLTKGTLIVDHKNPFFSDGAISPSQGISFGNGTAADDLSIEIKPGGKIQLESGQLVYNNAS